MSQGEIVKGIDIKDRIFTIRGKQVMLDSDLADLYGVETKRLNEQVKRNINRFPDEFSFILTKDEYENCSRSHFATLEKGRGKHKKYLPRVFSEHGVLMLSNVLKTETSVMVSVNIIKSFVALRKYLKDTLGIFERFENIEKKQLEYKMEADKNFKKVFKALESKQLPAKQGIFFGGQVFEAYKLVSDVVRSAKKSIVLIDNYVDDTVLTLFSKRKKGVTLKILTKDPDKKIVLDVKKFNEQFPPTEIIKFDCSHDRFMIIDGKDLYHFGASLKDLGKKWFAFSKMDVEIADMIRNVSNI